MADQDTEMQDAIPCASAIDKTSTKDLGPVLNASMQQLGIDGVNRRSVPLPKGRLEAGGDFGGGTSIVGWGWKEDSTDFVRCGDPEDYLKDGEGEHADRTPCIAALVSSPLRDDPKHLGMVFGSAARLPAGEDGTLPLKGEMLKLDIVSDSFVYSQATNCDEMVETIQTAKMVVVGFIRQHSSSQVYIQDPLTNTHKLRTIRSKSCITREYLRWLLQTLKAAIAIRHNLSFEGVRALFDRHTDVAMSLPSNSTEEDRAAFTKLLNEAGFPITTWILNEAKSATLYHVWNQIGDFSGELQFQRHLYVLDLGALTFDAYLVTVTLDAPTLELAGRGKAIGGFSGSQSWNFLFSRAVEKILKRNASQMDDLFPDCEDIDEGREALAAAIQPTKEIFSINNVDDHYIIKPQLNMDNLDFGEISVKRSEMVVQSDLLQDVSALWSETMISQVQEHIEELRATISPTELPPGARINVGLTGWGSLPPFVLEQFQAKLSNLANVGVERLETGTNSAVARGNWLTLMDEKLTRDF
ncbi:hypothetical protein H2200_012091 [Cladophialophora chaetospira]|uniref:Actin-like ATPase domain-containing protein n=1 Tax=Cladophialophora chaetospira TaxID=386627 RepID=A0AA38WY52_9EURO|nr:hypothetical protein H2200_012091 [Cladophialophora chaetospira]